MYHGSCNCGGVRFSLTEAGDDALACHCVQCRKFSGHYWASMHVSDAQLSFETKETLHWYTTERSRRGFCRTCGSNLFFDDLPTAGLWVALGALENTEGLRLRKHTFIESKGDYYALPAEAVAIEGPGMDHLPKGAVA